MILEKYPYYSFVPIQSIFTPPEAILLFTSLIASTKLFLALVVNPVIVPIFVVFVVLLVFTSLIAFTMEDLSLV